jgi:hypothetical protein
VDTSQLAARLLGEAADLNEFLFRSERAALAVVRPVLLDIQRGRCFYCHAPLTSAATHVDHFHRVGSVEKSFQNLTLQLEVGRETRSRYANLIPIFRIHEVGRIAAN